MSDENEFPKVIEFKRSLKDMGILRARLKALNDTLRCENCDYDLALDREYRDYLETKLHNVDYYASNLKEISEVKECYTRVRDAGKNLAFYFKVGGAIFALYGLVELKEIIDRVWEKRNNGKD